MMTYLMMKEATRMTNSSWIRWFRLLFNLVKQLVYFVQPVFFVQGALSPALFRNPGLLKSSSGSWLVTWPPSWLRTFFFSLSPFSFLNSLLFFSCKLSCYRSVKCFGMSVYSLCFILFTGSLSFSVSVVVYLSRLFCVDSLFAGVRDVNLANKVTALSSFLCQTPKNGRF
jgi:hypothetical protein